FNATVPPEVYTLSLHDALPICRIILDNEAETDRVRTLAGLLSQTVWQPASGLEAVPYIDGTPAGAARRIDVLWKDAVLLVEGRSDRKSTRLNSSHDQISYAVFC